MVYPYIPQDPNTLRRTGRNEAINPVTGDRFYVEEKPSFDLPPFFTVAFFIVLLLMIFGIPSDTRQPDQHPDPNPAPVVIEEWEQQEPLEFELPDPVE